MGEMQERQKDSCSGERGGEEPADTSDLLATQGHDDVHTWAVS